jgi:hypothetical protein
MHPFDLIQVCLHMKSTLAAAAERVLHLWPEAWGLDEAIKVSLILALLALALLAFVHGMREMSVDLKQLGVLVDKIPHVTRLRHLMYWLLWSLPVIGGIPFVAYAAYGIWMGAPYLSLFIERQLKALSFDTTS